jgi:CBS domain containing-hemolysin-like protein
MSNLLTQSVLVVILVAINAFFSASEYAIVAIRKTRIDELAKKGDYVAQLIRRSLENKENIIFTAQLGTTIVNLILGWMGEPVIAGIINSMLFFLPKGPATVAAHTFSVIISILILSFISVIFGELVPKTIALYRSELVSFVVITPLVVLTNIFRPFVQILKEINTVILTFLGFHTRGEPQLGYSKEEIKIILEQIQHSADFKKDWIDMVQNVFLLSDTPIKLIMTPRAEIRAVEVNTPIFALSKKMMDSYSRFPIYKRTLDDIVGFIHVKDVYKLMDTELVKKKVGSSSIIRKVISVPETRKADDVLLDMRKKHVHLAVVYNEFGSMVGIVTLEDIIESLVGEIQDEFDKPIKGIKRNNDGTYLIEGNMPMDLIRKRFSLPLSGQTYTTIGGLIFGLLGREPRIGDELLIGHLFFEIESIDRKRVKRIVLRRESKKIVHEHS